MIQDFSASQSSLFSHAAGKAATIVGGGGRGFGVGAGGRIPCSDSGGDFGVVEPGIGLIDGSSTDGVSPAIGGWGVVGVSTASAEHLMVGLPVVPGGHKQTGRWPRVWQSAFSPHNPG